MENATKAMLIAAGVLIGVMILSLGTALFLELRNYVDVSHDTIRFNELNSFNSKFLKYSGASDLTIQDVVTIANLANENNISYDITTDDQILSSRDNPAVTYVAVDLIDGSTTLQIEKNIQENTAELLTTYLQDEHKFECSNIETSNVTGRVYKIVFTKK